MELLSTQNPTSVILDLIIKPTRKSIYVKDHQMKVLGDKLDVGIRLLNLNKGSTKAENKIALTMLDVVDLISTWLRDLL